MLVTGVDTNECLEDNVCGQGECVNVDGGFECRCADGYAAGVDGTCEGLQHIIIIIIIIIVIII